MKTWLVGGAVRDELLGLPVKDRDWVVTDATPETLLRQGFRPVGRDFPVFLHPETGEEYALARTERKTGPGYHGFDFHAGPDVSLEEDLLRRDLTINAMARDPESGQLIDPHGGQRDLQQRLLRHVSPAFAEDPVRILRLARFAARFHPLGFRVADETRALMQSMVAAGEVDALVPERVWQELERALSEPAPWVFIETLRDCGALEKLFPEVDVLFGVPQPAQYHPEIDTGHHVLLAMERAASLAREEKLKGADHRLLLFAVLCHDLGKGTTPEDVLPHHYGHEARGVPLIQQLCQRMRIPGEYRQLAEITSLWHLHVHRMLQLKARTVLRLLQQCDAFRRPQRFSLFLLACQADAQGRAGMQDQPYPQRQQLWQIFEACQAIQAGPLLEQGLRGPAIGDALNRERQACIQRWLVRFKAGL